jgi:dipeptidase E
MKNLFLASEIHVVANHIAQKLPKPLSKLKTVFILTAAEPGGINRDWVKQNRQGLVEAGFNLFDYSLTGKTPKQIESDLKNVDIFHLNGGNMFYLLLQARKSGFDKFIKKAVKQGKIYTGSSAGSVIAASDITVAKVIEDETYDKELKNFKAFNLVNFVIFPHWGRADFKREYRSQRIPRAFQEDYSILLLNDYQYVQVEDDKYKIVDIRRD